MVAFGLFVAAYSLSAYSLGTPSRLGTGAFPLAIGIVTIIFGLICAVPAFFRKGDGEFEGIPWAKLLPVLAAVLCFAVLARPIGLVPTIIIMTVVASFADPRLKLIPTLILAVVLAALAVGIFRYGLNIPFVLFDWRW